MTSEGSITFHLDRLKSGDPSAARRLWEVYFQQMVSLARNRLEGAPRRAADEEDVALSAFQSFCAGAQAGRFPQLADRQTIWPLLAAITAHKSVDLIRRENRQKRGGTGRADGKPGVKAEGADLDALVATDPSPESALLFADQLEHLLSRLDATGDPDLRPVALWKMEGEPNAVIAARLGCVRRTVERKLQLIAQLWGREAEGE
jgi:DNA-directed RNA polymerase specialized sigma24 family protein